MSRKGFEGLMELAKEAAINEFGIDFNTEPTGDWYKLATAFVLLGTFLEDKIYHVRAGENIFTATGTQLDDILTNDLFFRIQGEKASGYAVVTGEQNIDIPINSIYVKGKNDLMYTNIEAGTLTTVPLSLKFQCTERGIEGNLKEDNFISVTKAPIGIRNVKNLEITNGLDMEDDYNYLKRYLANAKALTWELEAIIGEVRKLRGVISANGVRNNTMTDGVNGIPKKSIRIVVKGGDEQEIAETIYKNIHTPLTVGEISKPVETSAGTTEIINFDRPRSVLIDYKHNIISSKKEEIIELLKEYLNEIGLGEFISTEEFRRRKLYDLEETEIKVLSIRYKKNTESEYKDFLQLAYDEEGKAGAEELL